MCDYECNFAFKLQNNCKSEIACVTLQHNCIMLAANKVHGLTFVRIARELRKKIAMVKKTKFFLPSQFLRHSAARVNLQSGFRNLVAILLDAKLKLKILDVCFYVHTSFTLFCYCKASDGSNGIWTQSICHNIALSIFRSHFNSRFLKLNCC